MAPLTEINNCSLYKELVHYTTLHLHHSCPHTNTKLYVNPSSQWTIKVYYTKGWFIINHKYRNYRLCWQRTNHLISTILNHNKKTRWDLHKLEMSFSKSIIQTFTIIIKIRALLSTLYCTKASLQWTSITSNERTERVPWDGERRIW